MIDKVAIIDDDSIFQFTTKVTIERLNLANNVNFFPDGGAIYDFLKGANDDELPEVLLLDINMPITDGWDFLELYENLSMEKKRQMDVYMLSSSINPVDIEKADENIHVKEYLIKPIADEVLLRILAKK